MDKFNFQQGQKVRFDDGMYRGVGRVVGCSTIAMPIIGCHCCYMVAVSEGSLLFPNEAYPFRTISVFECHLTSEE